MMVISVRKGQVNENIKILNNYFQQVCIYKKMEIYEAIVFSSSINNSSFS